MQGLPIAYLAVTSLLNGVPGWERGMPVRVTHHSTAIGAGRNKIGLDAQPNMGTL